MHLSMIYPTTLSRAMSGKRWGFELYKIQMYHWLGKPVSQIPTVSPPKTEMGIYEGICLLMFTLLYMFMVSGQIPHV